MSVYLPTAAVGNGRILATLGASGEIMGLFWPHLDYANNVHEALPAVYLGEPRVGEFHWTWEEVFKRHQYYMGDTNILVTQLKLPAAGLELVITDFCPSRADTSEASDALVRRVRVENRSGQGLRGLFMHYFDLRLGEVPWKQAVRYDAEGKYLVQYFRDIAIAVGGTPADLWRCGKWSREDTTAKRDMLDGHLEGQSEDIGQCNFALAWRIDLEPDRSRDIDLILAFDTSRERAVKRLQALAKVGRAELQRQTHQAEHEWLSRRRQVRVPDWMEGAYKRSLLSLRLLADTRTGAIVAAPEFDPEYELCGGYGYCWPRDAADAAFALADAGYGEHLLQLAQWLSLVQLPEGVWGQRYWSSGDVAASWSLRRDFLQLDQSASSVLVLARALCSPGTRSRPHTLEQDGTEAVLWRALRRATEALLDRLDDEGYHTVACDLWETYAGTFSYTQAAFVAALEAAAGLLETRSNAPFSRRLRAAAVRAREALMKLFADGHFARGRMDGRLDLTTDSSTLGLVEPFGVLDLKDEEDRARAVSNLRVVEERLARQLPEGPGLLRYEGDAYMGGPIGAVNTLWAAAVCYKLALTSSGDESAHWAQKAEAYLHTALSRTTPTGLLPELIPVNSPFPYWAAPHAWASALAVRCTLLANELAAQAT